MKCSLGFFTPIWEKSWFSGRITAPSTTCQQREHRQVWCCSVFPWLRRFSSHLEPYLIDWYSSFGFLLLQVPHCADLVSARATNEVHIHTWCRQTFTKYRLKLWLATCTVPDHGVTIWAEAERGHCTVVALQHAHTLAGPQVPHPNATVHGGGEELQPPDVWVKLDQAGMRQRHILNMKCFCPHIASCSDWTFSTKATARKMKTSALFLSLKLTVQHQMTLSGCGCSTVSPRPRSLWCYHIHLQNTKKTKNIGQATTTGIRQKRWIKQ